MTTYEVMQTALPLCAIAFIHPSAVEAIVSLWRWIRRVIKNIKEVSRVV